MKHLTWLVWRTYLAFSDWSWAGNRGGSRGENSRVGIIDWVLTMLDYWLQRLWFGFLDHLLQRRGVRVLLSLLYTAWPLSISVFFWLHSQPGFPVPIPLSMAALWLHRDWDSPTLDLSDESSCSRGFPGSFAGKESSCNAGDPSAISGSGRSTGKGIGYPLQYSWASLVAQLVNNLPAMWETWVWSLGWEDPLEKGKATHSSIIV